MKRPPCSAAEKRLKCDETRLVGTSPGGLRLRGGAGWRRMTAPGPEEEDDDAN